MNGIRSTVSSSPLIANPMTKQAIGLEQINTMPGKTQRRPDRAIVTKFKTNAKVVTGDPTDLPYQP